MFARILIVELGPGMNEEGLALAERWTAAVSTLPGFVDVHFFGNDETGQYGYFSLWETREDAEKAPENVALQVKDALLAYANRPPVVRVYEIIEPRVLRESRRRSAADPDATAAGPVATLRAETPQARAALGGRDAVAIERFPFRVGREARTAPPPGRCGNGERRGSGAPVTNDLYLADPGTLKQISREHFQIERHADGTFEVVDRGSHCGLVVAGSRLSRSGPDRATLAPGDVVVVGTTESPYHFRFEAD